MYALLTTCSFWHCHHAVENSFAFTLIDKWGKESRSNGREFRPYYQLNRIFLVVNEGGLLFHPRKTASHFSAT
jgi:hypothetical protein